MKVVGLTGGIGSGKSTVAGFFEEYGIPVYIADKEAKKIMEASEEVRNKIKSLLGEETYEGKKPKRSLIASKVFHDKALLTALNKIVHPKVREHFKGWLLQQTAAYIIYEAAILFENRGELHCDLTILVTAPTETRIERLLKRDHSSRKAIKARMAAQWSDKKKRALADFHIENQQLEQTKQCVHELHKKIVQR